MADIAKSHYACTQQGLEATTAAKNVYTPTLQSSQALQITTTMSMVTATAQLDSNANNNKNEQVNGVGNNVQPTDKLKKKTPKKNKQKIGVCTGKDAHQRLMTNNASNTPFPCKEGDVHVEDVNNKTHSNNEGSYSCGNESANSEKNVNTVKDQSENLTSCTAETNQKLQVDGKKKAARKHVRKSAQQSNGFKNVINRTIFSILMAYIFLAIISMGLYAGLLVLIIIFVTMYHQIMRIPDQVYRKSKLISVYVIKWWSLLHTVVYVIAYNFRELFTSPSAQMKQFGYTLPFFGFCFILQILVTFVLSLQKGQYRSQFTHFTWTVMTVSILGAQFAGEISNLMHGMIWFLLPVTCVVNNDIWAYICGKLFGRTRLLALSPKKTLQGFVGASVFTVFWAFWFCGFLSYFPEMYCPVVSLKMSNNVQCERDSIFEQHTVVMPAIVQQLTAHRLTSLRVSDAQIHAIQLGIFASLLAPFAGFFASGLKRAFKLKDFGDLIPGHGGMTDRMDCQGLMGLFTYFYLRTYIYKEYKCSALPQLLACALTLSNADKSKLITQLQSALQ